MVFKRSALSAACLCALCILCSDKVLSGPVSGFDAGSKVSPTVWDSPLSDCPAVITVTAGDVVNFFEDNTRVNMRGIITTHIRGDAYEFRDESGTVMILLDHRYKWDHLIIGDEVMISGVVERDWKSVYVNVSKAGLTGRKHNGLCLNLSLSDSFISLSERD